VEKDIIAGIGNRKEEAFFFEVIPSDSLHEAFLFLKIIDRISNKSDS
jgi:hypothetical protein